tara:strand:+ start:2404 stop:3807 length:1404 start_codon:yes stop_codon:yes gene_type:complete
VFWVIGSFLIAPGTALANPLVAYVIAVLCAAAAISIFLDKVSIPNFGKTRAVGLIWLSFLLLTAAPTFQLQRAQERQAAQLQLAEEERAAEELAELRESAPEQYLARVREESSDAFWLSQLRELDPPAFQEETERRERAAAEAVEAHAAEVERLSAQRSEAAAAAATAATQRRQTAFDEALTSAERDISRPVELPNTAAEVAVFLRRVDRYASIFNDAESIALDGNQPERLRRFRAELVAFQRREFPRVRDALGPALRRDLWIDDATARTIGPGYRSIEFTSYRYTLNRNIQGDFGTVRETLRKLRFSTAVFRPYADGAGSRYDLSSFSPNDDEVVEWRNGIPRRLAVQSVSPPARGLQASGPGTIGVWRADCGVPCEIRIVASSGGEISSVWTYSDGSSGPRALSAPTLTGNRFRFPLVDEIGRDQGEYIIVSRSGAFSIYDRLGLTMTGELVGAVDFSMFGSASE